MIYIHDGEFSHGSGNTFPGHMLAASQEVIVVTLNYRLGALGFLATGDDASGGYIYILFFFLFIYFYFFFFCYLFFNFFFYFFIFIILFYFIFIFLLFFQNFSFY